MSPWEVIVISSVLIGIVVYLLQADWKGLLDQLRREVGK